MGHSEDGGCKEAVERLYDFLDGELTPERRQAIVNHLDECGPCLGAFDFEADLRHMIQKKCQEHVPDALKDRVARAIEEERLSNRQTSGPGTHA